MSTISRLAIALVSCGLFLLGSGPLMADKYYVSTSGDDTADGKSPERAWKTVKFAAEKAIAGDTVFIKAGHYRESNIRIKNSGEEKAPIVFQGYKNKPGEPLDLKYKPGDTLDPKMLPVLEGAREGIALQGKKYIEFRNLGVTKYVYAIYPQHSQHILFENLYVMDAGSMGFFLIKCDNVTIRNCVITDAADNNIYLRQTSNSLLDNCKTYGVTDDKAGATDYYIVLQSDCHDNVVRDCLSYNTHWKNTRAHSGHGIGVKDGASPDGYHDPHSQNNKFINCVSLNNGEYFFVAHEAHHNEFINCTAIGQWTKQARWSEGINIRDGAHDNTYSNCRFEGVYTAIAIQDTSEGPRGADQIATNNKIINCTFTDCHTGIEIWKGDNNLIENCVFDNIHENPNSRENVDSRGIKEKSAFIWLPFERKNKGNVCRNTIVANVQSRLYAIDKNGGEEILFTYSDFWNNKFDLPAGEGNMAKDPLYVDAAKKDFHLKSQAGHWDKETSNWVKDGQTSLCIDAGNPADDYAKEPQPNGGRINIGAYGGTAEASKSGTN